MESQEGEKETGSGLEGGISGGRLLTARVKKLKAKLGS